MFVYKISGCGFESRCSQLNFGYSACFEQIAPWNSGNYRVWIHTEIRTWHDKNIQSVNITWLKLFFLLYTLDQIFSLLSTVFKLFKNCFNKLITSVFTSTSNYCLSKFLINTNKFLSKTTRNVIFIFFWVRTFTTFKTL